MSEINTPGGQPMIKINTLSRRPPAYATLNDLADQANREHRLAESAAHSAVDHALAAGQALLRAKRQVGHGEWLPWLQEHFEGTPRTATTYMRLVERWPEIANRKRASDLSIRSAVKVLAAPRLKTQADSLPCHFAAESGHVLFGVLRKLYVLLAESIRNPGYWNYHFLDLRPDAGFLSGSKRPILAKAVPEWFLSFLKSERVPIRRLKWHIFTDPITVASCCEMGDVQATELYESENWWWQKRSRAKVTQKCTG